MGATLYFPWVEDKGPKAFLSQNKIEDLFVGKGFSELRRLLALSISRQTLISFFAIYSF